MKKLLDKASTDFEPKATLSTGSSASTTSANHAIPYHQSRLKLDLPTFWGMSSIGVNFGRFSLLDLAEKLAYQNMKRSAV